MFSQSINDSSFFKDPMLSLSNFRTSLLLLLNCQFMQEYLQIANTGKLSLMSFISRPLVIVYVSSLVNMFSINVALTSVILLGLLIRGNIPKLNIMSMKRLVGKLMLYFSRSRLKSPHRNIDLFGVLTFLIIISKCSLNIDLYLHYTQVFCIHN